MQIMFFFLFYNLQNKYLHKVVVKILFFMI